MGHRQDTPKKKNRFLQERKSGIRPHGVYAHRKNRDGLPETYSLDRHNLFHNLYSLHLLKFTGRLGHWQVLIIPDIVPPVQSLLAGTGLELSGIRKHTFHPLRPDSGKQTELRLDIRRELNFQSPGNDLYIVCLANRFFRIVIFGISSRTDEQEYAADAQSIITNASTAALSVIFIFYNFFRAQIYVNDKNATSPFIGILTY